jgi:hypothetical protein
LRKPGGVGDVAHRGEGKTLFDDLAARSRDQQLPGTGLTFLAILTSAWAGVPEFKIPDPRLLGTALAARMLTVLLDSFENHHIMTMVHSLEEGLSLSAAEGQMQMIASAIKFHASYLGVLLF